MTLTVNGKRYEIGGESGDRPLLWYLRETLGLKGTKFGCGHGACGACTVRIDGQAMHACVAPLNEAVGRSVQTIEGLAQTCDHSVIRAWIAEGVPQCRARAVPLRLVSTCAYDKPIIGTQITVGSMSVQNAWHRVRSAGADTRERLIVAAARRWNVDSSRCSTARGAVIYGGERLNYGARGVPPVAPAVANAYFAATRKRIRILAIR